MLQQQQPNLQLQSSKSQTYQDPLQELESAVKTCDLEALENKLSDNVTFSQKDLNRALLLAVQNCSSQKKSDVIECIRILYNAGANVDAEDPQDGKTALMIACEKGYIEIVDQLIQIDAQINLKDRKNRTPIMYALEANAENPDVVMQLIKKGAEVNVVSIDGSTPLIKATQKQYHQILRKLVEKGANLSSRIPPTQNTALHIACEQGDLETVRILMQAGCKDLESTNKEKETPLMIAERNQRKGLSGASEIYEFLKHKQDEWEKHAQKVNDELVKQEEIEKEKKRNKQRERQQQQTQHKQYQQQREEENEGDNQIEQQQQYTKDMGRNQQVEIYQDYQQPEKYHGSASKTPQDDFKQNSPMIDASNASLHHHQSNSQASSPKKIEEQKQSHHHQQHPQEYQQQQQNMTQNRKQPMAPTLTYQKGNNSNQINKRNSNNLNQSNSFQQQHLAGNNSNRINNIPPDQVEQNRSNQPQQQQQQQHQYKNQKHQSHQNQSLTNPLSPPQTFIQQPNFIQGNQQPMNFNNMHQGHQNNSRNQGYQKNKSLPFQTQQQNLSPQILPSHQRYPPQNLGQGQTQLPTSALMGPTPFHNLMPIGGAGMAPPNQALHFQGLMNQQPPQNQGQNNIVGSHHHKQQSQQIMGTPNLINNQNAQANAGNLLLNTQHSLNQIQNFGPYQHQLGMIGHQPTLVQQQQQPLIQQLNANASPNAYQGQTNIRNNNSSSTQLITNMAPLRQLPFTETLDLNDEKDQKIFILEKKKDKLEDQVKKLSDQLSALQIQFDIKCKENNDNNIKLQQADTEIQFRMNHYNIQQASILSLEQEKSHLNHQIENLKKNSKIQIDALKEQKKEMEIFLISICSRQRNITDQIIEKYNQKALFQAKEIEELQKMLNESQAQFNSFLIIHDNSSGNQFNNSPIQFSYGSGAPAALVEKSYRQNSLMKMIERYEGYNISNQDQMDHFNRLHEEILIFRESVRDILSEMQPIKEQLIRNITKIIKKAVPNSDVQVYGSHATKLCLPWSDIDLVIVAPKNDITSIHHPKSVLSQISRELQQETSNFWVRQVNFVENASVPVVKVSCQIDQNQSNQFQMDSNLSKYKSFLEQPFNIDITQLTDNHNGLECVKLVQEFLAENEVIEPLILVLKQYLKVCQYNDPYFGGISSYALFLMIVSYLQSQQIPKEISNVNLGKLLIGFFNFYGDFQFINYGIYTHLPGKVGDKPNHYPIVNVKQNYNDYLQFMNQTVQIDDPLHSHNNVGKSSFKFFEIKVYNNSYKTLQESFKFTGQVSFTSCFCDCHNDRLHIEKARQNIENITSSSRIALGDIGKRSCDSILSKIIYSYMQYLLHTQ